MFIRNRLFTVLILLMSFIFVGTKSLAFDTFTINCVTVVTDLGGGRYQYTINITEAGWVDDGGGRDHGSHVYYDANGVELGYFGEVHFGNYSGPVSWYTINVGAAPAPYRVDVYDLPVAPANITAAKSGTLIYSYIINPGASLPYCGASAGYAPGSSSSPDSSNESSSDIVYPPDDRINWQYGDLGIVLYRGTDDAGAPAIDAYCYDGTTTWLGMHVTTANMENGMSGSNCDVTFYYLPDSAYPYQWNIRRDGKLYETLCTDLTCEERINRYFDPNE